MNTLLLFVHLFITPPQFSSNSNSTYVSATSLKDVTVFQNGATMYHSATARLQQGNQDIIFEGVSSLLDIKSIQINCPSKVTILGVEFNNNYLSEEIETASVKKIKDSIEQVKDLITDLDIQLRTHQELLEVLKANKSIGGKDGSANVAELSKLMEYYKKSSLDVQKEIKSLNQKKERLSKKKIKFEQQLAEEQKKNTKRGGKLIVQTHVSSPGEYAFDIRYFTNQAYWTPFYDIVCNNTKAPLEITYKAKIVQTTGIDWNKVKLSLSTSAPQQYGTAPLLKTWFLGYINPYKVMNNNLAMSNTYGYYDKNNEDVSKSMQGMAPGLQANPSGAPGTGSSLQIRGIANINGTSTPLYVLNGVPIDGKELSKLNESSIKNITVLKDAQATALYGSRGANGVIIITANEGVDDYISVTESVLEVVYDIEMPYDVPTNGKAQIATLKNEKIPATYKHYAVPKLSNDVFLLAEVPNWEALNLMPGEANIIFEGTYIGNSFIDPATENDTLHLTMGVDKRVHIKRELMKDFSSVKVIGSNKNQSKMYELIVKNNKQEAIQLILKDAFPISMNKDIAVTLNESSGGDVNATIGVVTWEMNLSGGEMQKKRIGFSAKYPKNKTINL